MLALLPEIPEHNKLARRTRRILKKLRRAAAKVRDLDVQLDLIRTVTPEDASASFERDAAELRIALDDQRDKAAAKLLKELHRHQADAAVLLEELLDALKPNETLALAPAQLITLARDWFTDNAPPEPENDPDDPDHLHALRKNAKLARYIAENAPKSAKTPRRLAAAFESVQEAGGHWHDWLVLAGIASDRLGSGSPLTKAFTHRCHLALGIYRRHLREAIA
jgi:CHAD domain-containing protein